MSTIGHFVYFINYVKDSLSFRDAEDFTEKIRNDFDFLCDGNPKVFEYMNLNSLEIEFNRIQDYISQELGISLRLYDSDFELSGCD